MELHNNLIVCVISWLLAGIFAQACRHKVIQWQRFCASFAAYNIVPEASVGFVAGVLVVLEFLTVLALVFLQTPALWLAAGLLVLYAAGIGVNVLRGRTFIDCGCGDEPTPVSWWLVVRNLVLAGLSGVALMLSQVASQLSAATGLVAFALFVVAFALYLAVEQLLANRGRHQRLWLGVS